MQCFGETGWKLIFFAKIWCQLVLPYFLLAANLIS
jgi:hypothetical protein